MSSASSSLPPLQPPKSPAPQPPTSLELADGLFCTLLEPEFTSSFTPDNSRLEPPTYLNKRIKHKARGLFRKYSRNINEDKNKNIQHFFNDAVNFRAFFFDFLTRGTCRIVQRKSSSQKTVERRFKYVFSIDDSFFYHRTLLGCKVCLKIALCTWKWSRKIYNWIASSFLVMIKFVTRNLPHSSISFSPTIPHVSFFFPN